MQRPQVCALEATRGVVEIGSDPRSLCGRHPAVDRVLPLVRFVVRLGTTHGEDSGRGPCSRQPVARTPKPRGDSGTKAHRPAASGSRPLLAQRARASTDSDAVVSAPKHGYRSIESRIAAVVGAKHALFKGLFDGTTSEVRFDAAVSFASQVRKLFEAEVPEAPNVEKLEASSDTPPEETAPEPSEELTDTTDDAESRAASKPISSEEAQRMFAGMKVRRGSDGSMRIDAAPEAAATLAAMFETVARLLRGG
jgi:hypothetical protein